MKREKRLAKAVRRQSGESPDKSAASGWFPVLLFTASRIVTASGIWLHNRISVDLRGWVNVYDLKAAGGAAGSMRNGSRGRHPRRQIRPRQEPDPDHRNAGGRPAGADAGGARRAHRQAHGRLRHRLSRLAARRPRPAVLACGEGARGRRTSSSRPAINEDLAATALWGAQQAEMRGEGRYDGVFGVWYGKGPGVDRSGDALRHANLAGTSPWGGVVALMGDDHTCEVLDHGAPVRVRLRRRDDPGAVAGRRPGDHRLRPLRLRPVALRRRSGSG